MRKLKAYCILDGGGVKGAALVGALEQAASHDIDFIGYGGTSAGAIVALLAAIGYTPYDIKQWIVDQPFTSFLEDEGRPMLGFRAFCHSIGNALEWGWAPWKWCKLSTQLAMHPLLLWRLSKHYGVDGASALEQFLCEKLEQKINHSNSGEPLASLKGRPGGTITFKNLRDAGCLPLKIVSSNLDLHESVRYDADQYPSKPVVAAVLESAAYPFGFTPRSHDNQWMVDGGLITNLPSFLFEEESRQNRVPVLAIDLALKPRAKKRTMGRLILDLLDTALDGSDALMLSRQRNFHHVVVQIDPPVNALDFDLSAGERQRLYDAGKSAFTTYFLRELAPLVDIEDVMPRIQALYCSADHVLPILELIAKELTSAKAGRVRVNVMLPLADGRRMVIYQHGMQGMSDFDLILDHDGGCSGWTTANRQHKIVDMVEARRNPAQWKISAQQLLKIPSDLGTMISVPIFDTSGLSIGDKVARLADLPILGTLNVDSTVPVSDIPWKQPDAMNSMSHARL